MSTDMSTADTIAARFGDDGQNWEDDGQNIADVAAELASHRWVSPSSTFYVFADSVLWVNDNFWDVITVTAQADDDSQSWADGNKEVVAYLDDDGNLNNVERGRHGFAYDYRL
tara:strand:+ start:3244 stop:3582 length:339 start_codon:yes stop_codon:yes gene_type:complete